MRRKFFYPILFLLLLPACIGPIDVGPGLVAVSGNFSEAMRWGDFIGAANSLHQDVRSEFLIQFEEDEDLRIVESRLVSVDLNPESKIAEAVYRMEYYRLPSMQVKKWEWIQQWQLQRTDALKPGVWLILNPPPSVP